MSDQHDDRDLGDEHIPQPEDDAGDHLDPEPLAMDMEDVFHVFDPDRWTPDDPHDDDDYPFIDSDVQAPPG